MRETPPFIKMLVAADVAEEISGETNIVEIILFEKKADKGHDECLKLQLWFLEQEPFVCAIEHIGSDSNPAYLTLFSCKAEDEFIKELTRFFSFNPTGQFKAKYEKAREVLKLAADLAEVK